MEQYETNDYGVCVNPKIAAEYSDRRCRYAVKVAFIGDRWHTGIDVALTKAGIGCPVSVSGDCYETEREAVNAGLVRARNYMQGYIGDLRQCGKASERKAEIGCIRGAIADINRKLTEKEQLTLFDL